MFSKKHRESAGVTIIAQGSVVEGTLRASGVLQIDGSVEGTLIADGHVSVGPEGKIRGEVTAEALSIGGRVDGTVHARGHLHVLEGGSVNGDVRYTTLEVDKGGVVDGRAAQLGTGAPRVHQVELRADGAQAAE